MSSKPSDALPAHHIDRDAVLWNFPPELRAGKPLLVMMHGLGSHEGDLFGLNRFLPPEIVAASLRAPLSYGGGFAWFQPEPREPEPDYSFLDASTRGVLHWLDELDFAPSGIGLMGFSQGGCMALQLLREAPARFDYALQLSGFIAPRDHPGDDALAIRNPRVPVLWAHGAFDDIIPRDAVERTGEWLESHANVEAHRYEMAHNVCQDELADIVEFVTARVAG